MHERILKFVIHDHGGQTGVVMVRQTRLLLSVPNGNPDKSLGHEASAAAGRVAKDINPGDQPICHLYGQLGTTEVGSELLNQRVLLRPYLQGAERDREGRRDGLRGQSMFHLAHHPPWEPSAVIHGSDNRLCTSQYRQVGDEI
jgi:hypothetical protein